MDYDSIMCWLRTVKEAKREQQMFREWLSRVAAKFFVPRQRVGQSKGDRERATTTSHIDTGSDQHISEKDALEKDSQHRSYEPEPLSPVPPDPPWPP